MVLRTLKNYHHGDIVGTDEVILKTIVYTHSLLLASIRKATPLQKAKHMFYISI